MTVIRSGAQRGLLAAGRVLLSVSAAAIIAACNTNTNRGVTPTVGIDTGVALETAGDTTGIYEATTLGLTASVENPSNTAGVSWTISGVGSLTATTNSSATYVAPTTVTGEADALITATSIANSAEYASVTIIVSGSPVNNTPALFPANVNVPYAGELSVAGGETPFTWTQISGALPPGIVLAGSTSGVVEISGTPTAAGTYSFVLQSSDDLSRIADVAATLVVNPEAACLLSGTYVFQFSGFRGGAPATHTGSIAIDATTGNITGIQDYKDTHRTTSGETLSSGYCTNRENNAGSLKLIAPSGTLVYNFAATAPDSSGQIHSAAMQLISSGSDSGSGEVWLQDPTALSANPPSGNFAFGVLGVDSVSAHFGTIGRFTSNSAGTLSAGLIDSNDGASPLTNATLTGTVSAPNANGRGTLSLVSGSQTSTLAYYLINANRMLLMDIDSSAGTPIDIGQMTAQVGDVSPGVFDNNALSSPAVMSLFGAAGDIEPVTQMQLGILSNANPTAGTLDALIDFSDQADDLAGQVIPSAPYAVGPSGRGTLSLTEYGLPTSFTFYLDGIANGYIVQLGTAAGGAGLLEAQFQGPYPNPPVSGIFPDTEPNDFVGVTQYPQSHGPVALETLIVLNYGSLSSDLDNGSFAVNSTTGRGVGTLTKSGIGSTPASLYIVSPTKIDVLNFGTRAVDGSIDFLFQ